MTACQPPAALQDPGDLLLDRATLLRGPGRAPLPGAPPFEPSFTAALRIRGGLPEGATVWVKLLEASAVEAWGKTGAPDAVQARVEVGPDGLLQLNAKIPSGHSPREPKAGVEVRAGGRVLGRCTASVEEQFLPAGRPTGGRDLR